MSFVYVSDILKLPQVTGLKGLGDLSADDDARFGGR